MRTAAPSITGSHRISEALFAIGISLPIFAGGNTLFALGSQQGLYVFDLVTIALGSQLLHTPRSTSSPEMAVRVANGCLLVLGCWWIGSLALRPSGPHASFDTQAILCAMLLFATLSILSVPIDATDRLVRGLLLGSLVTVLYSQYQYWVAFPKTAPLVRQMGITPSLLPNANFYNANCYAVFLAAVSLLGLELAIRRRDGIALAALPLLVIAILLSQSRSVIALLGLTAFALGWRRFAALGRWTSDALWIVVPAAAGVAAAAVDIEELWSVGALGRVDIWKASVAMIRDHWFLGVGLGGFGDYFTRYRFNTYYTRYPHSFLLEIAAELGVVGLLGILGFLATALLPLLLRLSRAASADASHTLLVALCLAVGVLLVHGAVDIDWHAPANPILLFVLLGVAQRLGAPVERPQGDGC
jgi:O-antigen ligase